MVMRLIDNTDKSDFPDSDKQRGVVLIVALVLLLVMTSVGITTMTGTTLQERMASNSRQQLQARENATFALRQGEDYIESLSPGGGQFLEGPFIAAFTSQNELFSPRQIERSGAAPRSLPVNFSPIDETLWDDTNSLAVAGNGVQQPRYLIEYIGNRSIGLKAINENEPEQVDAVQHIFRITAIGWGANANSVSVLQSHYVTRAQ